MALDITRVAVEPATTYPIVGVLNRGRGLLHRQAIRGADTKYATMNRVRSGQVIYSRLKAFEGAATVALDLPAEAYASQEFPTFTCGPELLPGYFRLVTTSEQFWMALARGSKGMGGRRERVQPKDFLAVSIPTPPIDSQRQIVDALTTVDATLSNLQRELAALAELRRELLNDLLAGDRTDSRAVGHLP